MKINNAVFNIQGFLLKSDILISQLDFKNTIIPVKSLYIALNRSFFQQLIGCCSYYIRPISYASIGFFLKPMRWLSDHISNIKSRVWQQARILVLEQISAETYDRPFFSMLTAPLDRKPIRKVKVIGAFSSTRNVPLLSKANLGRIALALVIPVILPYICSVKMDSQLK